MSDSTNPGCFPATAGPGHTGIYSPPSTLPLGRWHVMANGRIANLDIESVTGSEVKGKYNDEALKNTEWDAATRRLTFDRYIHDVGGGVSLQQQFTGYLMYYDEGIETKWRMAGVFQNKVDPRFGPAGWYATLPRTK